MLVPAKQFHSTEMEESRLSKLQRKWNVVNTFPDNGNLCHEKSDIFATGTMSNLKLSARQSQITHKHQSKCCFIRKNSIEINYSVIAFIITK